MEVNKFSIYCLPGYNLSCAGTLRHQYDKFMTYHLYNERRLAHDRGPRQNCVDLQSGDIVNCVYLFGETILINQHRYGECLYLLSTTCQQEAS